MIYNSKSFKILLTYYTVSALPENIKILHIGVKEDELIPNLK